MKTIDLNEFVGKSLKDAVKDLDCNIKLGATYGSGFVYCGVPKETPIDFEAIEKKGAAFFNARLERKRKYISDCVTNYPTPGEYVYKFYETRSSKKITTMGYLKSLERYFNKMHEQILDLKEHEAWKEKGIKLKDRRIKDAYMSKDSSEPEGTIIILFEGYETGQYWTTEEAIAGVVERVKED